MHNFYIALIARPQPVSQDIFYAHCQEAHPGRGPERERKYRRALLKVYTDRLKTF